MEHIPSWLINSIIFLSAAVIAVPLSKALGLALSSTAIALQVMTDRNMLPTSSGQAAFAILLFQDVAAIPILALLPLLAIGAGLAGTESAETSRWLEIARILLVIASIVLGGRLLLRPLFRWIARSRTPEIFTAASLLLVVGIAALMQWSACRWRWAPSWPACCWLKANTGGSSRPTSNPSRVCCWVCFSSR